MKKTTMRRPGARTARRLGLLAAGLLLLAAGAAGQDEESFVVVVHSANPITELEAKDVSKIFTQKLKRWPKKAWPDDAGAAPEASPIDQVDKSVVREAFTRAIHGKSVAAIKSFWQRIIFSGDGVPPVEVPDDAEMLKKVRENPNAIGYVAAGTPLGNGVKALIVQY